MFRLPKPAQRHDGTVEYLRGSPQLADDAVDSIDQAATNQDITLPCRVSAEVLTFIDT